MGVCARQLTIMVFVRKRPSWPLPDTGSRKRGFPNPSLSKAYAFDGEGASLCRVSAHPFRMNTILKRGAAGALPSAVE